MYLGKEGGNTEQHLARCVVRDLTAPIEGNNHHLYMDNFYYHPHLFIERMNSGIYCCGTVRSGRKGFPRDILISKAFEMRLPQGHYQFRTRNQLVAMSWFARHGVYLLSSIHEILIAHFQLYPARMGASKWTFHVPQPKWITRSTWVGWTYRISLPRPFSTHIYSSIALIENPDELLLKMLSRVGEK